ncbi:hypothetical protein ADK67_33530 [Saccharothrix sp. NRRL B-16348]|uniref:NB-ARC domain-containing protein n=1 Tax=Saccharothrix sp. NRRL B-16348 TaxID=1415542 RepID=UPI0006AFB762|nr:NB-ARC domain-containing protein [Saccharothrix sp. NRRL B-16348]KOX19352.1 hypothetical protein ADK67_33530 [Saccharothrix sp. NRRL B-16348]
MAVQRQAWVAGVVTVVSIGVAVTVNLLTSGWSWLVFAVLALLAGVWVALEVWRAAPRREVRGGAVVPAGVDGFVPRPELTDQIVRALLSGGKGRVGITTTLAGAGGFGKTTLAAWVLRVPEVEEAFPDRYWVTVGQEMRGAALADAVNDVIGQVTGNRPGFTSPEQAGLHLGVLLADRRPAPLLVVDDVWTTEQLRPFLDAARSCTLLVTTRVPDLLAAADAQAIRVDQMNPTQARDLLGDGLAGLSDDLRERLLDSTGRWPLALRLANSALRRTARDGGDLAEAAERLVRRLDDLGPTALDVADPAGRERTVAATLESSLGALGDRRERALELAIFPEDTEVPSDVVAQLWRATAGLSPDDSERLCQELVELSLVERGGAKIRLHDVIRTYLRHECGPDRLTSLHRGLLDQAATALPAPGGPVPWWTLPPSSGYLWRWLSYHLNGAGRGAELAELATTPGWVLGKLRRLGPVAVAEDLALVATDLARELARVLDQIGHLLVPGELDHAVVNALAHRLPDFPAFDELRTAALAEVADHPRLTPWRPLPDLPDPALNRVLVGHDHVDRIFFAPDATWLATVGGDGIRVWRPSTGQLLRVVPAAGSRYYSSSCALSRDGRTLAVSTLSGVIRFLDTTTWEYLDTRLDKGSHWPEVCGFVDDGRSLVTEGDKDRLVVWDVASGRRSRVVKPKATPRGCADLGGGRVLVVHDEGLEVRDPDGAVVASAPTSWGSVGQPVVSPDRRWAVVPSEDGLLVWDLANTDHPPITRHDHVNLSAAAFFPGGGRLATGDDTGLIVLWDTAGWRPVAWIPTHAGEVGDLAVSADGVLASLGSDSTVRLWNPDRAGEGDPPSRTSAIPDLCAAAPDGSWIAFGLGNRLHVANPRTWAPLFTRDLPGEADGMAASPDGTRLVVALGGTLHAVDAKTWEIDTAFDRARWVESLQDLVWSPDGTMLATVADDRVLRVHDSRDGRVLAEFRLDGQLKAVTWVAADRLVVVGSRGVCWFAYTPRTA